MDQLGRRAKLERPAPLESLDLRASQAVPEHPEKWARGASSVSWVCAEIRARLALPASQEHPVMLVRRGRPVTSEPRERQDRPVKMRHLELLGPTPHLDCAE